MELTGLLRLLSFSGAPLPPIPVIIVHKALHDLVSAYLSMSSLASFPFTVYTAAMLGQFLPLLAKLSLPSGPYSQSPPLAIL
jgi:hypothetical protein